MRSDEEIFGFPDYRDYLRVLYERDKATRGSKVSLELYARKLGISKSHFRFIIVRKRHISLDQIPKVAKVFGLNRKAKETLTYMVCRHLSRDPEIRKFFDVLLMNLGDRGVDTVVKESISTDSDPNLFGNWLAMTIHSLSKQSTFRPDVAWIKSALIQNVDAKEIESVLKFLIESKCILQDETGRWRPAAFVFNKPVPNVLTGYEIYKIGLNAVLPATEKPELHSPHEYCMMSLSFDDSSAALMKAEIKACRDRLIGIAQGVSDPIGAAIVNLNFAAMARRKDTPS